MKTVTFEAPVYFTDYDEWFVGLKKQEVIDIVNSLFRGKNQVIIIGDMCQPKKSLTMGRHCGDENLGHTIYLNPQLIKTVHGAGRRAGGNTVASNYRMAIAMVLAHEIQHANQTVNHSLQHRSFFGKKKSTYKARPCERDARQFADDSIYILSAILNENVARKVSVVVHKDELDEIVDCLRDGGTCTTEDIVQELRHVGLNNPVNVVKIKTKLREKGVQLS